MNGAPARATGHIAAGHKQIEGTLNKPILEFDLAGEIEQLHQDDSWKQTAGRSSKVLVKHPDLRIVLIAMKAGSRMHEHTAAARISIHALTGHVRLHLAGRVAELPAGRLVALDECVPHDVEAREDCAFLLTFSWPPEAKSARRKPAEKKSIRRKRK
jgi:quercetin dioxygenase-like cupin family protein